MTLDRQKTRTDYVAVPGGSIAYSVLGEGPLVVMSHGIADTRDTYRFLAPRIAEAGYRVASVDLRGHGGSSTGWKAYDRADTARDLVAVIQRLGGAAVIVGQSFSGGAATIAAATSPELVDAVVEIDPATRPPKIGLGGLLRNRRHRKGTVFLGEWIVTGSFARWSKYLDVAYPGERPADWDAWRSALADNLREPGRMQAALKMAKSSQADAGAALADVRCPVLVIMGRGDPDWADPEAEAAAIVGLLPAGLGRYAMIDGAGHYPHAQRPERVAHVMLDFLAERVRA